jgi:hypothetical protein
MAATLPTDDRDALLEALDAMLESDDFDEQCEAYRYVLAMVDTGQRNA